jgi:RsiW-degrading membrane proteinase PrsW (M82 family)
MSNSRGTRPPTDAILTLPVGVTEAIVDEQIKKRLGTLVVVACVVAVAVIMFAGLGNDDDSEYVWVILIMGFLGIWSWVSDRKQKRNRP